MRNHIEVEKRKALFKPNSRIVLTQDIADPFTPLKKGLKGTVRYVDDMGTVHPVWDSGSTLGAVLEDKIALI